MLTLMNASTDIIISVMGVPPGLRCRAERP